MAYTLELLHFTDQEAASAAVSDAPNLSGVLNALIDQDLGNDGIADNTLVLSSGDAIIPGLFFDSSEAIFGAQGIADIQIQNELGVQAIALGNHEFDLGPDFLASLISGTTTDDDGNTIPLGNFGDIDISSLADADFMGAAFPYLSANLNFDGEESLDALEVAGGSAPQANTVTSSVILTESVEGNGIEQVAVIGATTPTIPASSSPGGVTVTPNLSGAVETPEEIAELAATIQAEVDAVLAANPDLNKVILLAHMQNLDIERQLAEKLENVDVIVGGGSDTILTDDNDVLRDGQESQGTYPEFITNAGGTTTALVNTDGQYQYVGRLVIDFDDDGNVLADSYDADISGAYATDDAGLAAVGGEAFIDPEVQAIADAIAAQIVETESNVLGYSDVFLNANRAGDFDDDFTPDGVRTQETNLGNLTADANLAYAQAQDDSVVLAIKNGGGIRANIGESVVPAGESEAVRTANQEVVDAEGNVIKAEGGISENDIKSTLAFNNDIVMLTLTKAELVAVLEHGIQFVPDDVDGAYPQIAGVKMAYDNTRDAGDRIVSAGITDSDGNIVTTLVSDGEIVGDADETFRITTLGFLASPRFDEDGNFTTGGDGYPFPNTNTDPEVGEVGDPDVVARVNFVNLTEAGLADGTSKFADAGTEQDALAEYLQANHGTEETAFSQADLGAGADSRIVQLDKGGVAFSVDTSIKATETPSMFAGEGEPEPGDTEGLAEIVSVMDGKAYVSNGEDDRIDVFNTETGALETSFDVSAVDSYDGIQSVQAKNGVIAAAISRVDEDDVNLDGRVVLFDTEGNLVNTLEVGNHPDALSFSEDGTLLAVANEGEYQDEDDNGDAVEDAPGGFSIIDLSEGAENATVRTFDFTSLDGQEDALREEGVRIFPGRSASEDLEPEYVSFSPDGETLFVSLQENNAIAVVDVATGEINSVFSTGTQDLSEVAFDVNDRDDVYAPDTFEDVVSMRMADTIVSFESNGQTYLMTANEGDARDEDVRVQDIIDGDAEYDLDGDGVEETLRFDESFDTTGLERLEISAIDGDTDGDGDIDVAHAYGGRSFSIFDTEGNLVFDSGDDFGRIAAAMNPNWSDGRSDNKGVEPEAIEIGQIGDKTFAFIGLERDSGIMVYDVTEPENSEFVNYIEPGETGVSPESIDFVASEDGEGGQLFAAYEFDGVTKGYDLEVTDLIDDEDDDSGDTADNDDNNDNDDDDSGSDPTFAILLMLGLFGYAMGTGAGFGF